MCQLTAGAARVLQPSRTVVREYEYSDDTYQYACDACSSVL
jgi:hypothetical protein